jgi:seryl-tRNA synthetase
LTVAEINPNVIIDISTKIAEIGERTKALQDADKQAQEAANHRHRNVMQAIEQFVPRREIEAENVAIRKYAEQMADAAKVHCDANREAILHRVTGIEKTIGDFTTGWSKIKWALIFAAGSGALSGLGYIGHLLFTVKLAITP